MKGVRHTAMAFLARREHSRYELRRKLSQRFPGEEERIEIEVDQLAAEGLQSNARLAEVFIRSRVSRGQGPSKIRLDLKNKGVADQDIAFAFEEAEVDWFALASQIALKKFGVFADQETNIRLKARVSRFMHQRGFSYEHIASLYGSP